MLKVGQKLWYVPSRGASYEVEVTKVGRKWATVGEGFRPERIDLETWYADGSSPGRCYLNQETYLQELELSKVWGRLQEAIRYGTRPDGVTLDDIKQAMKLLKVSEP